MGTDLKEGYYERDNIKQTTKNSTGITGNATGRIDKLIILQYSVVLENAYSRSQIGEGYLNLYVVCSGADSPRSLKLRNKPSTGQWFLWEQQLLTGIRIPKEADPWA